MPTEPGAPRAQAGAARGIVALDASASGRALALVDALGADVIFYKIGLELFAAEGPEAVRAVRERGKRVFLDLKLHDIPNTVAGAARAAAGLGAALLTVHAGGGRAMVQAAVEAAGAQTRVLGVTALTSLDPRALPAHFRRDRPLGEIVLDLAEEALAAGAAGIVCAAAEVAGVKRRFGARCLCVVPGIRAAGSARDDQARAASPGEALRAGADLLVIGRTVTAAADPRAAWRALWADVEEGP
jgi:orotidine-5'-phosphate decarboxylase